MDAPLTSYYRALYLALYRRATYRELSVAMPTLPTEARLHVYQLCLHHRLYLEPHYRSGTFGNDSVKNLRNVALPGSGMPLSLVCMSRLILVAFLVFGVPLAAFIAALISWRRGTATSLISAFSASLFATGDQGRAWFHYWRLNCVLASYHALRTTDPGYALEDKLTFLQRCELHQIPVSPWMRAPKVVVKHRNEEGGLGMHTYSNADSGGDWIIQEWLGNASGVARLLPDDAPLSTLRLITASKACARADPASGAAPSDILMLSACFRAGREGASTDHSCVMFDIDVPAGVCKRGTSNAHWYQLGLQKALSCPWVSEGHTFVEHPDTGRAVAGEPIPGMAQCVELVRTAHLKLMPGVPLVGWDVAITKDHGTLLLEANLSCNFFRATFDVDQYCAFVESVLHFVER